MKATILAIDTSTEACSAAILQQGCCVWRFQHTPNQHTKLLLPMISELLAETGLSLASLDAIAVTRGPGSFTGVRIGIGMAQGFSFGLNIPVYEISTLTALAYHANCEGRVIAAIDARMQELYTAMFDCKQGEMQRFQDEALCRPAEFIQDVLAFSNENVTLVGSGWDAYHELLTLPPTWQYIPNLLPHAKAVAALAYQAMNQGQEGVLADRLHPVYLRDNVAVKSSAAQKITTTD